MVKRSDGATHAGVGDADTGTRSSTLRDGRTSPDEPFREFVEGIQEGALTLTPDGTVLYANAFFLHLVGARSEEVLGSPFALFIPDEYHSTFAALLRGAVAGTEKGDVRLEASGGETIPVQLTLSPLGGAGSCCAIVFDLRDRERREEAHAARVAAEEASRAKDQFLAALSHELRAPLNTALGWAQILVTDPKLGETSKRAAETIERNVRAQAGLIDDLLDISRIVAGKLNLEMTSVSMGALTGAALDAARPAMERKNLQVRHRLGEEADVYGDASRLRQIVTNLLDNAVKFTKAGGSIDVALETEPGFVVLRVSDTGIGMTGALIERAFDAFQQGRHPQRRSGGLGLGLAIAKQLTEAHGGTLTAESEGEGKGATFSVRLPRVSKAVLPPRERYQPHGELAGLVALLVEDDKDNLELTQYLLESAGCEVLTASSAEGALERVSARAFGLLVSDIGLPDRDGLELMRAIRARGYDASQLPAIALTGYAGLHDAKLVTAAGYQRHLAKPLDGPTLIRAAAELGRK